MQICFDCLDDRGDNIFIHTSSSFCDVYLSFVLRPVSNELVFSIIQESNLILFIGEDINKDDVSPFSDALSFPRYLACL